MIHTADALRPIGQGLILHRDAGLRGGGAPREGEDDLEQDAGEEEAGAVFAVKKSLDR